jgi:hypothetical protein
MGARIQRGKEASAVQTAAGCRLRALRRSALAFRGSARQDHQLVASSSLVISPTSRCRVGLRRGRVVCPAQARPSLLLSTLWARALRLRIRVIAALVAAATGRELPLAHSPLLAIARGRPAGDPRNQRSRTDPTAAGSPEIRQSRAPGACRHLASDPVKAVASGGIELAPAAEQFRKPRRHVAPLLHFLPERASRRPRPPADRVVRLKGVPTPRISRTTTLRSRYHPEAPLPAEVRSVERLADRSAQQTLYRIHELHRRGRARLPRRRATPVRQAPA